MEYTETNYAPELAYRTLHNYLTFMEQKTGCVRRDQSCRAAAEQILTAARQLRNHSDTAVSRLAEQIIAAAQGLEE